VLMPLGVVIAPQQAYAQTRSFHMDHYDADITVNTDGTMDIVETLAYVFDEGTFRRGTRFIPTDRLVDITNVAVEEVGFGPYEETEYNADDAAFATEHTFGTLESPKQLNIRWIYSSRGTSQPKTFKVSYRVTGGIRVYPNYYQLDWVAIPPEWGGNIDASRVTVHLPSGVDATTLDVASKPEVPSTKEGNTVTWNATNVNSGLEVGIKQISSGALLVPPAMVQQIKSKWQDSLDTWERVGPFLNLGLTGIGLLILIVGPLWTVRKWYKYGRDLPVAMYTDYVPDAPSDLPPGLVGTLLDESADVRDVIATIVDQGRKQNLTINELESGGIFSSKDFEYRQTGTNVQYRYEEMVLNALFRDGSEKRLSDLKNNFYKDISPIYSEMYEELVRLQYFPENPSAVRARNVGAGIGIIILGVLVGVAAYFLQGGITLFPMIPAVALGITGLVRIGFSGAMPRKTDFGSGEAQKWRAFKRYLEEIQRYTNVQAAADKFQKYLPYAVALGIEKELINQFNSVPTAMPPYYIPYGWYPYGAYPTGTMAGGTSVGGGGGPMDMGGAMQNMSDSFGSAMQSMSDSFTSMVNSASSILTSQPSSSGSGGSSGWGGGGGSFGGGGGGGGGGGAD